jgi:hypothetical protein
MLSIPYICLEVLLLLLLLLVAEEHKTALLAILNISCIAS